MSKVSVKPMRIVIEVSPATLADLREMVARGGGGCSLERVAAACLCQGVEDAVIDWTDAEVVAASKRGASMPRWYTGGGAEMSIEAPPFEPND